MSDHKDQKGVVPRGAAATSRATTEGAAREPHPASRPSLGVALGICHVCMGIGKVERPAEHLSCVWCDDGSIGEFRMCEEHWHVWVRICLTSVLERLRVQVYLGAGQYEHTDSVH